MKRRGAISSRCGTTKAGQKFEKLGNVRSFFPRHNFIGKSFFKHLLLCGSCSEQSDMHPGENGW
jgi:hypothetical protein